LKDIEAGLPRAVAAFKKQFPDGEFDIRLQVVISSDKNAKNPVEFSNQSKVDDKKADEKKVDDKKADDKKVDDKKVDDKKAAAEKPAVDKAAVKTAEPKADPAKPATK
jgi:hypothetical protein